MAVLSRALAVIAFVPALFLAPAGGQDDPEKRPSIQPGDHICLIGNTLADRMQHDGWLESVLHTRLPQHRLVIRNLGFSGDELTLRLRSHDFGTPDAWLTRCKADVVFAFFGYNESFAGKDGLPKFNKDLADFIKHIRGQRYNGKSAPRLVLFSPIAHENRRDGIMPDGSANNQRLSAYSAAMAEVAKANRVEFVDLFHTTAALYANQATPLTINGVHLTEDGNRHLSRIIDRAFFPDQPELTRDPAAFDKVRQAVLDKNFHWFNRYRTVDGYSIYGGRADLKFVAGQTNRDVMQREMAILDAMTANRDHRIWAAARGENVEVNDSNVPPFVPVTTNKPGPLPGGKHLFLSGEAAIGQMTVANGMKVNLFASEEQFPELTNPVQMAFDTKGRLWVAVWPTYPHWKPKDPMNDKLLILEDTDGDGKADRRTVFADGLHCPTGFEFWGGGVLVALAPDLLFLKDTDGDGKADIRERVLSGLDSADTHHAANSFTLDPGGALYFQEGTFHHTQVETPYGPSVRCANAGVFRYEPRTQKFETYISYGFANPHGHAFDRWGQDIVVDGTGANPFHAALFSGHLEFPHKHARPPQVYQQRTRPCPGIEFLSSRHFPESSQGNLLVPNVIGFQGILQYRIADQGASYGGSEVEPVLSSRDPNFRPSDLEIGPDGALYFCDWQNPIIGHMQHNLRDPSRDREHGRVYRVTYEGRPLLIPPKIAGEPIAKLLDLLKEPEDRVRYRARIELSARNSDEVETAVRKWVADLNPTDPNHDHHVLEALWVHQQHSRLNVDLLKRVLSSPDFRARAAAARVLCYWRDKVPDSLALLRVLAADSHPRVRLEAVRAASFFVEPEAIEVVLIAEGQPADPFIDFVRGETMRALDPFVKKALAESLPIRFTTSAGTRYFLKVVSTDDLIKMKGNREVYGEILLRKGIRDENRHSAVTGLAQLEGRGEEQVLLDAMRGQEQMDDTVLFDLVRLLTGRPAEKLAKIRVELEQMAMGAARPVARQLGFVALVAADGGTDAAWTLATRSIRSLEDMVSAMPLIRDPGQRAALYPKVEPLLERLPKGLASTGKSTPVVGRYIRIELPGPQRTLTLAEVEVYSDGKNAARSGKATQKTTAHGGEAARAIDGNASGRYADRGQSHTAEGQADPWWEVDLGVAVPIDSIAVSNRTDVNLSTRLNGFTLRILGADRAVVFERTKLPTPEPKASIRVGHESPERVIRRAAMAALPSVRGKETEAFKSLARFVGSDFDRHTAIQAIARIPAAHWPVEETKPLLDKLLAYIRLVPVSDRTAPAVLDALQLADSLAASLPREDARRIRRDLGELGVRIIRLGTVPDQMIFDKERLAVRAGKPVEIVFENTDLMPHNFVVTRPGALEEVGLLAEATATQAGAAERHYVPTSDKVLVSSRLLAPRDSQTIRFTAPSRPGVYPYVCTYPGHWRRMYGALYVVEDLDEYLADGAGYLARHPLPVADEMLKLNRPRKEWSFAELAPSVEQFSHGRSFANGRQMFKVASCITCHKVQGAGTELGPDLTKLEPKHATAPEILRDVLEPSARINEKYQGWVFELESGKVVTGLVLEESSDSLKVIENPLIKAEPVVLKKTEVVDRKKSPSSVMPKGLLDKLTRDEILDLIAFVAAKGDPRHKLFQDGHQHAHPGGH